MRLRLRECRRSLERIGALREELRRVRREHAERGEGRRGGAGDPARAGELRVERCSRPLAREDARVLVRLRRRSGGVGLVELSEALGDEREEVALVRREERRAVLQKRRRLLWRDGCGGAAALLGSRRSRVCRQRERPRGLLTQDVEEGAEERDHRPRTVGLGGGVGARGGEQRHDAARGREVAQAAHEQLGVRSREGLLGVRVPGGGGGGGAPGLLVPRDERAEELGAELHAPVEHLEAVADDADGLELQVSVEAAAAAGHELLQDGVEGRERRRGAVRDEARVARVHMCDD